MTMVVAVSLSDRLPARLLRKDEVQVGEINLALIFIVLIKLERYLRVARVCSLGGTIMEGNMDNLGPLCEHFQM